MTEAEREAWLAQRRTGITGTDVSAILGINPWASPLDVWLEKRNQAIPKAQNMAMKLGNLLEPVVASLYSDDTGAELVNPGFLRHKERDWHIGTPDRISIVKNPEEVYRWWHLIEIKTARSGNDWGEPETDQIPRQYLTQVAWYLSLTDLQEAHVAVLIGASDYRRYVVHRDMELEGVLLERCEAFWKNNVLAGQMPQVDGSETATKYITDRFPRNFEPLRLADSGEIALAMRLKAARDAIATAEAQKDERENLLKIAIGDAEGIDLGAMGKITWKNTKPRETVDWKSLAVEAKIPADMIARHTKTGEATRRFLPTFKDAA